MADHPTDQPSREGERMVELSQALEQRGVQFVAINLVRDHIDLVLLPDDVQALTRALAAEAREDALRESVQLALSEHGTYGDLTARLDALLSTPESTKQEGRDGTDG